MEMTLRWYGSEFDTVTLEQIRQIPGVKGVITTLYDTSPGEVWSRERIRAMIDEVEAHGLHVAGIESVNVHDSIKAGLPDRDRYIDNYTPTAQLADMLNALNEGDALPRTILYSLNPADNVAIGTVTGCFQDAECAGKIQQGSAWWFNDNKQGILDQMTSLASTGLLGNFIGMLTDSRSFLSYTRHEYFRRLLCELIGGWVENGEYPDDEKALERLVKDISCRNVERYFGFDLQMPV